MADVALSTQENDTTTPEYKHRKKLVEAEKKRKKSLKPTEEYFEFTPDKLSRKGGKVVKVTVLSNGNKHRVYVGHEKKMGAEFEALKKSGKLRNAA